MCTITDKEFHTLTEFIKENYGINIKEEKKSMVTGRLRNLLIQNDLNSYSEYYDYILSDETGEALNSFIDKITTNHTFFMREPDHFTYFSQEVLPYLTTTISDKDMRIWSAGCSSGEEPYTLAMIMDEFLGREKYLWDTKILATDLSSNILQEALRGVYSNDAIECFSQNWQLKYFKKYDKYNCIIKNHIKKEIIFRKFNLMDTIFPFKRKFHVIFCRNVMIYFDQKTKCELVNKFYDLLEDGGYLFIGHAESLYRDDTKFTYIMPSIYRKI
jgi:Methylase of chemotaxis methyl-accepting proteins